MHSYSCFDSKFCPSLLEIVGLQVPARYIRDFSLTPRVKIVPLLTMHQLLIFFAGTFRCYDPKPFSLNI
jgi:hypothetical protein